jgi:pimeloyl-ACP methyl ester carboxylesterase
VLLIADRAAPVQGYFPQLATILAGRALMLEVDIPGVGSAHDGRPIRLAECAGALAEAVRAQGGGPLVVVGHGVGGLVALRLAVDEPLLVGGLLLLDPTPPSPPMALKTAALSFKVLARLGRVGQLLWYIRARSDLRDVTMDPEQEKAVRIYTDRGVLVETARWAPYLAEDGAALASDLAAGRATPMVAVVVSAGFHRPLSIVRPAHQQLAAWLPNAVFQVWPDAPHALHIQQPVQVADLVLALLQRVEAGAESPPR